MKLKLLVYAIAIVLLFAGLSLVLDFYPEEEKALRQQIRQAVEDTFPEDAAAVAKSFGLFAYAAQEDKSGALVSTAPSVVLIHGLDDPGAVWQNLAPILADQGMNVWQMYYPNDQAISDSASLFASELQRLSLSGVNQISIVAHSMGGLVSREMLTSPGIDYRKRMQLGQLPVIRHLIMVGTPNHGSELARYRFFSEFRDQWVNIVENGGSPFRGFMDGAGEAKIDLLPESAFLQALNARAHPQGVKMLTIAGLVSAWNEQKMSRFLTENFEPETATEIGAFVLSMNNGLGDGLVTVDSSRLEGVEQRTVNGTHLTMIRNLSENDQRIAPAIPIIVEVLNHDSHEELAQ